MKNEELYLKLLRGDKWAFRRFYREVGPKLLQWILTRVGEVDDAEEITQDTFLAFLDSLPAFAGKSSLWTFLVSIAKHEVADYWRKRYAKKALRVVGFVNQVYTERLYSATETAEVIERVYARLLPEEVVVLRLKYEEELSVKEIARKLSLSVKAVESRLFRARHAFQVVYGNAYGR